MIAVTFENSTYCGADCTTCVRKEMKNVNQNMPDDLFCSIIDQLKDWNKGRIEAISFVGNGDPLMDAHVIEKFRYIKEHTSFKIHLTNTCHMLKGNILDGVCEYVDTLKISHYGFSEETFKKVHGGVLKYDEIVAQIEELLRREKRPRVCMSFLLIDENRHEIEPWIAYWKGRCDEIDAWTPHNWAGIYQKSTKHDVQKSCGRVGRDYSIHVDGKVSACCLDACENLLIGDLKVQTWQDIVEGDELKRIARLHDCLDFEACGICADCDLTYDRTDALIYTSNPNKKVGMKAGYEFNAVDFTKKM